MNRILTTESGSVYRVAEDGARIQRINPDAVKRADGEWVNLLHPLEARSYVGERLMLVLEPLVEYGPDDNGSTAGGLTTRVSTPVVEDTFEGVAA